MTAFERFDDETTEKVNEILESYAMDIHTMAHSYREHIRPTEALKLFEAIADLVPLIVASEGNLRVTAAVDKLTHALNS